jgi:TolA-binding protein
VSLAELLRLYARPSAVPAKLSPACKRICSGVSELEIGRGSTMNGCNLRWGRRAPLLLSLFVAACSLALVGSSAMAQEESSPEALTVYADAANFQNAGEFELSVDEWQKFLKQFPKDPLAGKAQHYLGVCQLQLKKYDKAAQAFEATIANHPKLEMREDAYLNLGWSQYTLAKQGNAAQYAKASATFAAMIKEFTKDKGKRTDQALYFLGEALYAQNKKPEAVAAYEQLVKEHEQSPMRCDALYALGVTHEELGQYPQAGQTYDVFLKDCGTSGFVTEVRMRKAETVLQAGLAAEAGNKTAEAKQAFAEAEKLFGEAAAVKDFALADHSIFRQAVCVEKQQRDNDAGDLYARIATEFASSGYATNATIAAAKCFYRGEKYDEARKWFQKSLDGGGDIVPEAAHWICRIDLRNGEPAKAADLAAKTLPSVPADNQYLVNLKMDQADALYELPAKRAEALALYLKIATDHAQHEQAPQALYNAAFATLDLKKFDDGLKHTAEFLKAYPTHKLAPDVKYVAAECNLLLDKHAEAEQAYRDLTANSADHAEIEQWQVRLGLSLYLQKKYQDTIDALKPLVGAFKKPVNIAEGQFLIGASQFYLKQYAPAAAALTASLAADAKWLKADETLLYLSRSQRELDKQDEAIKTIKKLIADFGQSRLLDQAHYRLAEYSYAKGDYKTAIAEHDVVLKDFADSAYAPYSFYGKGWAQLKNKDYKSAVVAFTGLVDKDPKHALIADTHFARGMCQRQVGAFKEAVDDINVYLKSNPDKAQKANALYELGLAQTALKDHAGAAASFSTLLKDNPKYASADKVKYELAWALKLQGKNDEALAAFAKLVADHANSPLAAEANFHVGEKQYEDKQYAEAAKSYAVAQSSAGKTELGEKSTYKLGWSNYQQKQYDEALKQFSLQAADYPQGPLAAEGVFMKAECLFKLDKFAEALPAFTAAQTAVANNEKIPPTVKAMILLHGGQSAGQLKQWPESLKFLEAIPANYPESDLVPEALYEIAWANQNLGKLDEALKLYEMAATKARPQTGVKPEVLGARSRFMMGEVHFLQKNFDEAIKEFKRVMLGFRGEQADPEVKKWQAKAGYEAGRCADVQIQGANGEKRTEAIIEAKNAYGYVVEKHPTDDLVAEAKKRLAELDKLK